MSGFSIRNPFFIIVCCLIVAIVGTVTLVRMPVDLFPPINIPVVVVATFYSGMPPQQVETNITNQFERFFTLASGVDHIESRSLPGVSLIKIYFQPGTNADSDLSTISNLAMADLRRLPPGTLPPVVLKFDASSLPVCLITLKGEGLNQAQLQDLGRYDVRNQIANVPGATDFEGKAGGIGRKVWNLAITTILTIGWTGHCGSTETRNPEPDWKAASWRTWPWRRSAHRLAIHRVGP